jgi:hypothetical protein
MRSVKKAGRLPSRRCPTNWASHAARKIPAQQVHHRRSSAGGSWASLSLCASVSRERTAAGVARDAPQAPERLSFSSAVCSQRTKSCRPVNTTTRTAAHHSPSLRSKRRVARLYTVQTAVAALHRPSDRGCSSASRLQKMAGTATVWILRLPRWRWHASYWLRRCVRAGCIGERTSRAAVEDAGSACFLCWADYLAGTQKLPRGMRPQTDQAANSFLHGPGFQ